MGSLVIFVMFIFISSSRRLLVSVLLSEKFWDFEGVAAGKF